jgi:hypothetical protein
MSDFKKHNWIALGISIAIGITGLIIGIKPEFSLVLALPVYLGSNFPDLDTASKPSMYAARFSIISSVYFIYIEKPIYAVIVCIVFILPKIGKHRGWTHKYSTPIILSVATYLLFEPFTLIAMAFSIGLIVGHYVPDKMNPFELKNWI